MSNDFTTTFSVDQDPARVFAAINDVRAWWSGNVEGRTDKLGAEFTYEVPGVHYTKHRITELVPDRSVAWLVVDSNLSFTEDKEEWTGTTVRFDIVPVSGHTEVRFTHEGLVPVFELLPGLLDRAGASTSTGASATSSPPEPEHPTRSRARRPSRCRTVAEPVLASLTWCTTSP